MQGREDQVACEASLDGDLGGLEVADLSHQDHVGILAQDRAQPRGKREADLRLDLDLADSSEPDFHRVFDGDDVLVRIVDVRERGVECGRLPGAGGARHQNDAVAAPNQAPQQALASLVESDPLDAQQLLGSWQKPKHATLPVLRGNRREPHVVVLARDLEHDASILGQALFGDVELAHDFDARGHRLL